MNKAAKGLSKINPLTISPSTFLKNEEGAIDLASIMVGIIVIGMIGGVIAATVFAVIPWSQDNAAKQQLDSVVAAESAYMGLSSTNPPSLPAGLAGNSYGNSSELETAGLLKTGPKYCVSLNGVKSYTAFSQSSSGKIWSATDTNTKPVIFTGTLPTDCQFITSSGTTTGPYTDPTPKLTTLTYMCNANSTTGSIPLMSNITGVETWDDGVTNTYTGANFTAPRTLLGGVTYTVTFNGTYENFNASTSSTFEFSECLRSVDHWGSATGVQNASNAFRYAINLTSVPEHIPTSITNMSAMFAQANQINDPNISKWDVSNVTNMDMLFGGSGTRIFNQPLNNWNVSNVESMIATFNNAANFNQPLDKWDTSKVRDMENMFSAAISFNQPLNSWNVSEVRSMNSMFNYAISFNQPLNNWNTAKVTNMLQTFYNATNFNQNLSGWNTTSLQVGFAFANGSFPEAYLPPGTSKE